MEYNFTEDVRRVLQQSRDEAVAMRHDYIGTEHILLGLTHFSETPAARILTAIGIRSERIRELIADTVRLGKGVQFREKLPYTSRAKKVLEYAMSSAREMRDPYVGSEHLLLGLVREEKGIAAQILGSLGATRAVLERATQKLRDGIAAGPRVTHPKHAPADGVWFVEIDSAAGVPIYEQIIARIEEAVATGRLVAGERLPPVRELADELGVAPGTVARAYSALERKGVLETGGSRGTHVADRAPSNDGPDAEALEAMLRPIVVAAFHMGADAARLREALEHAMRGIYPEASPT